MKSLEMSTNNHSENQVSTNFTCNVCEACFIEENDLKSHMMKEHILGKRNGRTFKYDLNGKRAKSKLLKGAKRTNHLEIEIKSGCVNMRFSDGSYHEVLLPVLREWQGLLNKPFKLEDMDIKVEDVESGIENTEKIMDTKLVVFANEDRLVLHAYNGTQNLMVQGKNFEDFAVKYLKPLFTQKIEANKVQIEEFNSNVQEILGKSKTPKIKNTKPFQCPQCKVKPTTVGDLKMHMKSSHSKKQIGQNVKQIMNEDISIISLLDDTCDSFVTLDEHSEEKDAIPLPQVDDLIMCNICEFDTEIQEELDNHNRIIHGLGEQPQSVRENVNREVEYIPTVPEVECNKCDFHTTDIKELNVHHQTTHMRMKVNVNTVEQTSIACDQCDYKCGLNIQLKKHMKMKHEAPTKYTCKECEYSSDFIADAWEHTLKQHPDKSVQFTPKETENMILKIVAEQNTCIFEELEILKKDIKGAFIELANVVETCINNLKEDNNEKCKTLANTVIKLHSKVVKLGKVTVNSNPKLKDDIKSSNNPKSKMNKTDENIKKKKKPEDPPQVTSSKVSTKASYVGSKPSPTSISKPKQKPKVLFVGDSVGHTANLRVLENFSNVQIKSARAYSSAYDKTARWPEHNFTDVVKYNLENHGREEFDMLVMSAPTVDVTNLESSKDRTELYEQRVIESSRNMFSLAQQSLDQNKGLSKVVIMEHHPRFDSPVNSKLAGLANTTLSQLWVISPLKDKIIIGRHSLESYGTGATHLARYQDYNTGRYDGVHLYGRTGCRDYTDSVKTILRLALPEQQACPAPPTDCHKTCPQAKYQWEQYKLRRQYNEKTRSKDSYAEKVKAMPNYVSRNKFDVLYNLPGNF